MVNDLKDRKLDKMRGLRESHGWKHSEKAG